MTWIKICGITNLEDALTAVKAGADALGFVFYEKSPRKVDTEHIRKIVADLPERVEKIGVLVNATEEEMETVAKRAGLTGLQLHGPMPAATFRLARKQPARTETKRKIYVSLPARFLIDECGRYKELGWYQGAEQILSAVFLDSGSRETPGGTGRTFNWKELEPAVQALTMDFKVVVAGGLTSGNVAEAMRILQPWGVDVSSGVEAKPGKKDPEKIRAFIAAVRQAEKSA